MFAFFFLSISIHYKVNFQKQNRSWYFYFKNRRENDVRILSIPSELYLSLLTHLIIRIIDKEKFLFKKYMASNVKHFSKWQICLIFEKLKVENLISSVLKKKKLLYEKIKFIRYSSKIKFYLFIWQFKIFWNYLLLKCSQNTNKKKLYLL